MSGMRAFLSLSSALFLSGCGHAGLPYLWQAARGQLALYNHERPISEVLADPLVSHRVKERLRLVGEMKSFVEKELGVKATGNYTTYVDLKRPYVVWVVVAAPPFSLEGKTWSFPIAGEVPYLGFFSEDDAKALAGELTREGFDTGVRGAAAYSTLGWLRDPLLSSMLSGDDGAMANLIFHETTHSHVYLGGESGFNEAAASFIGEYGERLYLERRFGAGSEPMKRWAERRELRRRRALEVKAFAQSLSKYYEESAEVGTEARSAGKRARFQRFFQEAPEGTPERRFRESFTGNADLMEYLTYEDDQGLFDGVWKKCGADVKRALAYLKAFADRYDELKSRAPASSRRPQDLLGPWDAPCP